MTTQQQDQRTTAEALQNAVHNPHKFDRSNAAKSMFSDLMSLHPSVRRPFYQDLNLLDRNAVLGSAFEQTGTPYGMWVDDPVGFTEDVLGDNLWSKQRAVLEGITQSKRVAVPSAFGTGKTHIAARAALWRSLVHPPGTSLTVTTATRFRQVVRQLWPHIRTAVASANLPLIADQTQLKAVNRDGIEVQVAYGFSAPPHDEAAVQGIHAPRLFIVIDEAGGISRIIGAAMRGLLTGDDTRMLAIGNPPTDDEGSWFEKMCLDDGVLTIPISAYDAPMQTGEWSPRCTSCPPEMPAHPLAQHLVGQDWIDDALKDYGPDAPFVVAKVHARFPKGGPSRTIPSDWIEAAQNKPEPTDPGYIPLSEIAPGEQWDEDYVVQPGAWVRLGVDVAADGGDEMVVSRCIGDLVQVTHHSAGSSNTNSVDVAGKILEQIRQAENIRRRLGTANKVRVKVDSIGVGWGVVGTLQAWGTEGLHDAEIVPVNVSEGTYRDDDETATLRPANKRSEMWLTTRALLQPQRVQRVPVLNEDGILEAPVETHTFGQLRYRLDDQTRSQLSSPTYGTNSQGKTVIETKAHMKQRGLSSPDRAEAVLLVVYEPLNDNSTGRGEFEVIV